MIVLTGGSDSLMRLMRADQPPQARTKPAAPSSAATPERLKGL